VSKSELRRLEIVAPDAIKQLREQIAQEIEADCKRREHAKGSVTSVGVNGNSVSFFEPVVCKSCANAAAIARGEYEPQQSKMSANNNIFRGVVVISKSG